ncbi:MAG: thiopurine S-methyltransferase [Pseudomonadota bacterium]
MEEQFWQSRWEEGRIAFHEAVPNRCLTQHLPDFSLRTGSQIFVPLCGKSVDLDWLLRQGHNVAGVEFNQGAVETVFERMALTPTVGENKGVRRFQSGRLTLWQGDLFALKAADIPKVDLIYDRAALVALPAEMRTRYGQHLVELSASAPHLLVSYTYDQSQMEGPPFSVSKSEIEVIYQDTHSLAELSRSAITGPLATRCSGGEHVWKLTPK